MLENVGEVLQKIKALNALYKQLNELYKKAKVCFSYEVEVSKFAQLKEKYLDKLMACSEHFEYFPNFGYEEERVVDKAFKDIAHAVINREQFKEIMSPIFEKIEAAIQEVADKREEYRKQFSSHYAEVCDSMCVELDPLLRNILSSPLVGSFVDELLQLDYEEAAGNDSDEEIDEDFV